ncbi:Repulsive guidance molecule A-like protein [Leptotrombidium deliense]|uniref:Repulsive guidance molecule A-like protein n=1 Tax=Leptotrombidium deliense TaxID=299467 RepID=A0A443SQM5_9ACAR|nr:Repulsive guidance molecule A-like protein [Leptotrombidium deliense]
MIASVVSLITGCEVERCSQEYAQSIEVRRQCQQSLRKHNKLQKGSKEVQEEGSKEYCDLLKAYNHCMRVLSKSCRGNIEYHTLLTLVKRWIADNNCVGSKRPKNTSICSTKSASVTTKSHSSNSNQHRIENCLRDAYNYTSDVEKFSYLKNQHRSNIRTGYSRSEQETVPKNNRRQKLVNERHPRNTFDEYEYESEDNGNLSQLSVLNVGDDSEEDGDTDVDLNSSQESLTCILYGDPHLRTFAQQYQTCRCVGAWPLIEHPLFAVQITSSKLKGYNLGDATGVTRVTVLIRQFRSCEIYRTLIYEAEADERHKASLPSTFTDGSSSTSNNLVRIVPSSLNVVTLHLEHIGVEIHIGDFSDHSYLSVVVKLNSVAAEKQQHFMSALNNYSLCKNGCPLHEQIDINTPLKKNVTSALTSVQKNMKANDPCRGLFRYYRSACLYDVTIKGMIDSDNSCRFGQSFDYFRIIENKMYLETVEKQYVTTNYACKVGTWQLIVNLVTVLILLFH